MPKRLLSIHFPEAPDPASLPEIAGLLLALSPTLGIRSPDTIYLEIGSVAHLFGGEAGLLTRLFALLKEKRVWASAAIADDLPTAGVLARSGLTRPMMVPGGKSEEALRDLPLSHLSFLASPLCEPTPATARGAEEAIHFLSLLGIKTLGDFARLPAATIGPRFGKMGAELHRRARGAADLPLHSFHPTVAYRERFLFDPPTTQLEPILFAAKALLAKLEEKLRKDLAAALEMTLFLETEDCEETELRVPLLRPLRKEKALLSVIRERLHGYQLRAPLISITLELALPVAERGAQFHLFDSSAEQSEKLDELLGRLVAGIGPTLVSAAKLRERYRPEASWTPVVFEPYREEKEKIAAMLPDRPTILVQPPEPLRAEIRGGHLTLRSPRRTYAVLSLDGPERLQGEWWDDAEHARDYFRAQTEGGEQLWIFQPLAAPTEKAGYFLHGYFD